MKGTAGGDNLVNIIFCNQEIRAKGCRITPHHHNCYEVVFYGDAATGETNINGVTYGFSPASVALIPPDIVHSENHFHAADVIFLGFETSFAIPEGIFAHMEHIKPLFFEIAAEMRSQEWGYQRLVSLKLQEIITYIQRRSGKVHSTVKDLTYCKQYIAENYMHDISISELARMTCYSRDRFRHLFTEAFGVSPQNYLIAVRMENALQLLATTKYSCTDIANMCGFSDSGQMTKMIKKKYGQTPKFFRQNP